MEHDAYLSDESDFYGSKACKAKWTERTNDLDVLHWFETNEPSVTKLANIARDQLSSAQNIDNQYNIFEGDRSGRQLSETVDEFCNRLPPATTSVANDLHWIWIANPFVPKPISSQQSESETGKHSLTDDPPTTSYRDLSRLITQGNELLQDLRIRKEKIAMEKKGTAGVVRATNQVRDHVVKEIHELAQASHVTSGKWMLFVDAMDVNEVWSIVAHATATSGLGVMSKVAPKASIEDREARLICVYTKDFQDTADVERVLLKLKSLGLFDRKPIYYKPDVYTHLALNSGNEFAIKTSLYSSSDMLKPTKQPGGAVKRKR